MSVFKSGKWKLLPVIVGLLALSPLVFAQHAGHTRAVKVGEVAVFDLPQDATCYISVEENANLVNARIESLLTDNVTSAADILMQEHDGVFHITAGTITIAVLTPDMTGLSIEETRVKAQELADKIRQEFDAAKRHEISASLMAKFFISFVYPLLMIALLIGLRLLYRWLLHAIYRIEEGVKIGQFELVSPERLRMTLRIALVSGISVVLVGALYAFLAATFYYFPATRGYAMAMYGFTRGVWNAFTQKLVAVLWRILAAGVVIGGAFALVNTVDKLFDEIEEGRVHPTAFIKIEHIDIFEYIAKAFIVLSCITVIVLLLPGRSSHFGMVVLAFLGLSLSFGFVPVLKNAAAGFLIAFSKTHYRGAVLIIDGHEAAILRTGVFFTSLRFANGEVHQLPNRQIFKGHTRLTPRGDIVTWTGSIRVARGCPLSEIQESLEEWAGGWSSKAMVRIVRIENGLADFELKMPYLQSSSEVFVAVAFDGLHETMMEKKAELLSLYLKT